MLPFKPPRMPDTNSEPKTDPRIHFAEIKAGIRELGKKIDEHAKHDEQRFDAHAKRFVSYKWLISICGAALAVIAGIATFVIKTNKSDGSDMKKEIVQIMADHTAAEAERGKAVDARIDANAAVVGQTQQQVQTIFEAIVDGKVKGPNAARPAKMKTGGTP